MLLNINGDGWRSYPLFFHFIFAHFKDLRKGFIILNLPVKSTYTDTYFVKGKIQLLFLEKLMICLEINFSVYLDLSPKRAWLCLFFSWWYLVIVLQDDLFPEKSACPFRKKIRATKLKQILLSTLGTEQISGLLLSSFYPFCWSSFIPFYLGQLWLLYLFVLQLSFMKFSCWKDLLGVVGGLQLIFY